nr:tyrosine-type recombinase/integrase [Oceanipulchritudo coccoides]
MNNGDVGILTVNQAEDLLHFTRDRWPEFLGIIVLGLFAGIRTEELQKLTWDKVNLKDGYITIDATISKKRRIRHTTLPDNAREWILTISDRKGNISPCSGKAFDNVFVKLRREAGYADKKKHSTWPRNAMRHSFGTYHYALHGDATKTAKELGHKEGDQVLFDHYRALATKAQGEAFFGIKPGQRKQQALKFKEKKA